MRLISGQENIISSYVCFTLSFFLFLLKQSKISIAKSYAQAEKEKKKRWVASGSLKSTPNEYEFFNEYEQQFPSTFFFISFSIYEDVWHFASYCEASTHSSVNRTANCNYSVVVQDNDKMINTITMPNIMPCLDNGRYTAIAIAKVATTMSRTSIWPSVD